MEHSDSCHWRRKRREVRRRAGRPDQVAAATAPQKILTLFVSEKTAAADEVGFFEHTQRPKRDVFEIAYRRRDDEKSACHYYSVAIESDQKQPCPVEVGPAYCVPLKVTKYLTRPNSLHYSVPELDHNPIM